MFSQAIEYLFPNVPAHITTYENAFCQRARFIDLRQVVNPNAELFQFWIPSLPTNMQAPFKHGFEFHNDAANDSRLKKNRADHEAHPFLTIEVDELIIKSSYNNQDVGWSEEESLWLKQTQKAAMYHAANRIGLPYTVAIDSGNKSIHFVFRLNHTPEELISYRSPRGENHHYYKYLQMLLHLVFGTYDNGVLKEAGYKLTRAPHGIREGNNIEQRILNAQPIQTTIPALIKLLQDQLDPRAVSEILTTANFSYKAGKKSKYSLLHDEYFKDLVLGPDWYPSMEPEICIRNKGERGTSWYHISKKLAMAGQKQPHTTFPTYDHPLAEYDASFLWHVTAFAFNAMCHVPFWRNPDLLRWDLDNVEDFRAEPATYGLPSDMSQEDLQLQLLLNANVAAADPVETEKINKGILKAEKERHQQIAVTNPNFRSNIAGINSAMMGALGGGSGKDDFNYGAESAATIRYLNENNINLKYVIDNDEARRESWWQYANDKHIWQPLHKIAAEKLILSMRPDLTHMSPHKLSQLVLRIRSDLMYNKPWTQNQWKFVFTNGTLTLTRNPKPKWVGEVAFFMPNEFDANDHMQILCDYPFDERILRDPNYRWQIASPKFASFMNPLFESPADDDRAAQEFLGQALWPLIEHQMILIVRGQGGDGKGVLASIITAAMGGRAVDSVFQDEYDTKVRKGYAEGFAIKKLAEKHAGSMFIGPHLLIDDETAVMRKLDDVMEVTNQLKKISGEGTVMREDKGVQISKEKSEARFMLLCNNEPQFHDPSKGIWRRCLIVRCEPAPDKRIQIGRYHEQFATQEHLPAIFNYLLTGLFMFQNNVAEGRNGITMTPLLHQRVRDLRNDADPVPSFFHMFMEAVAPIDGNLPIEQRYPVPPISIDILLKVINQMMFDDNERYTLKKSVLENALKDNKELAGKHRLHEFKRRDSAEKAGTIGLPTRSSRIGVLYGYTCTFPALQEIAGNMFHDGVRAAAPSSSKDINTQGTNASGFAGGL